MHYLWERTIAMINETVLAMITVSIQTIAFYKQNQEYHVDIDSLNKAFKLINEILAELDDYIHDRETDYKYIYDGTGFTITKNDAKDIIEHTKQIENTLKEYKISKYEFDQYLNTNKKSDAIIKYFDLLTDLKLTLIRLVNIQSQRYSGINYDTIDDNEDDQDLKQELKNKHIILNHHNPFSDVIIDTQTYLYPNENGEYTRLSFTTNYKATVASSGDQQNATLIPNFEINKQALDTTNIDKTTIVFDDTLATDLPKKNSNHALYYLN